MSALGPARAVAGADLRRLSRDRVALFFLLVLPFVLILALGSAFPGDGDAARVGVVSGGEGGVGGELRRAIDRSDRLEVTAYGDRRSMVRDIRLGQLDGGVVIPAGLDEAVRAGRAAAVEVDLDPGDASSAVVRNEVGRLVEDRSLVLTSIRFATASGVAAASSPPVAEREVARLPRGDVAVRSVGGGTDVDPSGFAFVAMAQMVLFMFINALAGGASLVEMRTSGVAARSLSAPIRVGDVVGGITAARFGIALGQGLLIVVVSAVVFGVDWGDPAVLVVVVTVFALVAAGAGVLTGALARTPDQAPAVGVPLALAMAALGGCFFPLSLEPPAMQVVARVLTPQAWATSALSASMFDGASPADVVTDVAVLCGWAALFLVLGTVALRRRLERP